ncbi:hypothetical protein Y1Q_0015167 [Alligator mississippiensis]|uniref:Uncharacterized protein n=1 Tax=Alligator mississippiensis TaxID=8496 RepID=A0A151P906_ALLMI|nr:hypothetical protein Y1Q_0015167 [Alligator mississippiensis]
MLDMRSKVAKWMGLCFNAFKCATLHINCRKKSNILDSTITIQGKQMRCLKDGESYLHLGMSTDHWAKQMSEETICGIVQDAHKLDLSLLVP